MENNTDFTVIGALLFAAIPLAVINGYVWHKWAKNEAGAAITAILGFAIGLWGGLIFGIPATIISIYFSREKIRQENLDYERYKRIQEREEGPSNPPSTGNC